MPANIPLAVRELVGQYRRFLRTSYRFLDEGLRRQFEEHLAKADVVGGPFVTLAREFVRGRTLAEIVHAGAVLFILSRQKPVAPVDAVSGAGLKALRQMLDERARDAREQTLKA